MRCLVRTPGAEDMFDLDRVDVHYGSVTDPASLKASFYDLEEVVHLVAVIQEQGGATFSRINVEGTRNVLEAAAEGRARRFVHLSAIGAQENPRMRYLHSKWLAEQLVHSSDIPYTILRPSLLFGEGDELFNALAGLVRTMPVVPVVGNGRNEFQPISAEDVALCVANAIDNHRLRNRLVEIGGPHRLSYNQLVDEVKLSLGARRLKFHMPVPLMRLPVWLMGKLFSKPPVTQDQLNMLQVPNYAEEGTVEEVFGFAPRPVRGNVDYVRQVSRKDGVKMLLGSMPRHIRDH